MATSLWMVCTVCVSSGFETRVSLGNGGNYMLYCDEYDKDCSEVTSDECDNGCCDSCMYCVICTDEE